MTSNTRGRRSAILRGYSRLSILSPDHPRMRWNDLTAVSGRGGYTPGIQLPSLSRPCIVLSIPGGRSGCSPGRRRDNGDHTEILKSVLHVMFDTLGVERLDRRHPGAVAFPNRTRSFTWTAATRPGSSTRRSSGVRKSICSKNRSVFSLCPKSL